MTEKEVVVQGWPFFIYDIGYNTVYHVICGEKMWLATKCVTISRLRDIIIYEQMYA
jgi:hypothetical protein